ncbi:MAG: UDP-N-acetylmuramoyl-tripeptide--D-alanyl-D-alanine ligase, partial [Clostridia bacterium]|nr:UDP-N-acetylmuramoyl-tripeptide--D-alanyl-D-alanine ligase [Clostridia bacterium]
VVAAGERARILYDALPREMEKYYFSTRDEALPLLESLIKAGDTVLFKASNSMGFDRLAAALKERMGK